jgi:hypothetical protein
LLGFVFGQLNLLPDYPACLKTVALAFLVLGSSLYLFLSALGRSLLQEHLVMNMYVEAKQMLSFFILLH